MGPLGKLGPRRVALPASRDKIYVGFPGERSSLLRSLWVINGPGGPEIRLPLFPRNRTQVGHRANVRKVPKPEVEVVCPTYTAAPGLDSFGAFDVIAAFPSRRAPKWRSVDKRRAALQ